MLTSHDIHGPLVRPRKEKFWTWKDPLGFRDNFRYEFEMEIFDALETESEACVMVGNKVLKKGSTYNDHYGFGTSKDEAAKQAAAFAQDLAGAAVDIIVMTKLITKAVFLDAKNTPFYHRSVRCYTVPGIWRTQEEGTALHHEQMFETWRNGDAAKDTAAFEHLIADAKANDAAGDHRKGDLR